MKTARINKFEEIKKKKKSFTCILILRFNQPCPLGRNESKGITGVVSVCPGYKCCLTTQQAVFENLFQNVVSK